LSQVTHPSAPGHVDLYNWQVQVPAAGLGRIAIAALHGSGSVPPKWSFTPARSPGRIQVFASYPTAPENGPQNPTPGFDSTTRISGTLQRSPDNGEAPSDIRIQVTYNPTSDTTMAFVFRDESGRIGKADLGTATTLFRGSDEYLVPALFDEQQTQQLFVAVDLTQWLSSPASYGINDRVEFSAGVSDTFPGFLVATSPIRFDPEAGFVADAPYTGGALVLGEFDGQAGEQPQEPPPPAEQPIGTRWGFFAVIVVILLAVLALVSRRHRPR
jgi:hypothetical protein